MLDLEYIMKVGHDIDIAKSITPTSFKMNKHIPDVTVTIGGTTLGRVNIPIGTRFSPVPGTLQTTIFTTKKLIWAKKDNNGSIIIIDQDTVKINDKQYKLVHPLKLNALNLYSIWINENPAKP